VLAAQLGSLRLRWAHERTYAISIHVPAPPFNSRLIPPRAAQLARGSVSGLCDASVDSDRLAYAIADDNLRQGRNVIGDSVNGWSVTRNAWRDTGVRAGPQLIEVEIMCSDLEEHRRRVETRDSEVPGLLLPNWQAVMARDYEPWDRDHLTIDTAVRSIEDCARLVRAAMSGRA
jgi:chloramphenicol 3-O-phosphotransferase